MKKHLIIIEPGLTEKNYWRDLWRYRELFIVLAWRDVAVRYKQTIFGLAWALIQPLATMIIFTLIFGKVAKLPLEGVAPYALMVLTGMLPWQLFASSLMGVSGSLINNTNLISKVYFPRLILPISSIVVSFVDFLISLFLLIGLMIWYQFSPGWQILTLPFFIIMTFLASLGLGLWIAALNVKFRDFRYIIPFIVQFGLFLSPVGFSSAVIPNQWRLLYSINPLVGIIDGFRWAILGGESNLYFPGLFISFSIIIFFLWIGIRQFRKMEKSFADLI